MQDAAAPWPSVQDFRRFLLGEYQHSGSERITDATTYLPHATYPLVCQTRTLLLYQALRNHLGTRTVPARPEILDIGLFPGTQLRALAQFLGERVRLAGVGLALDDAFRRDLAGAAAQLREVDLDPFYVGRSAPIRIDLADASFDAIYALEIFEHFISPLAFLAECARLLKPGAILCLSTPNVSSLGAIYQLIRGRSNYEALDASPMYQPDSSWRGHSRIYARDELITLFDRFGMELVGHAYYHEAGARYLSIAHQHRLRTAVRRWMGALVPQLRDDQFAVFRRRTPAAAATQPGRR